MFFKKLINKKLIKLIVLGLITFALSSCIDGKSNNYDISFTSSCIHSNGNKEICQFSPVVQNPGTNNGVQGLLQGVLKSNNSNQPNLSDFNYKWTFTGSTNHTSSTDQNPKDIEFDNDDATSVTLSVTAKDGTFSNTYLDESYTPSQHYMSDWTFTDLKYDESTNLSYYNLEVEGANLIDKNISCTFRDVSPGVTHYTYLLGEEISDTSSNGKINTTVDGKILKIEESLVAGQDDSNYGTEYYYPLLPQYTIKDGSVECTITDNEGHSVTQSYNFNQP